MGRRGPAPRPKRALLQRGSRRAKKMPDDMELEPGVPRPPADLCVEALAEWQRVVPVLAPKGVLSEVDRAALVVLVASWSEYVAVGQHLDDAEMGTAAWQRIAAARHQAYQRWAAMAQRFGLTPADRARVKVPEKPGSASGKGRFFKPRIAKSG